MTQKDNAPEIEKEEVYTKAVRAGKRTYFFDVKATRGNEHYLTITESKKITDQNGQFFYEKHKVFLYREDFEKFMAGLNDALEFLNSTSTEIPIKKSSYAEVEFEDLGKN